MTLALCVAAMFGAQGDSASGTADRGKEAKQEFTVDSVIELVKAGISDGLIIRQLRRTASLVDPSPADLLRLQKAHVSEKVIAALMDPTGKMRQSGPSPAPPAPRQLILPAGTEIAIRTIEAIDSRGAGAGTEHSASVDRPVVVDGVSVVPAWVLAFLRAEEVKQVGPVNLPGAASLSLRLVAVTVDGRRIRLETGDVERKGIDPRLGPDCWGTFGLVRVPPATRFIFRLTQPTAIDESGTSR